MIGRREFLWGSGAALLARAQPSEKDPPARRARVVPLFRSPDGNPNALETTREGLWIGEQGTDAAYLVDWSGKVLRKVETESSNTSGIAFGGGFLWMGSNGHTRWRAPKPTDSPQGRGEILKVDPETGKTVGRYPEPGGGGVHGLEFAGGTLWSTSLKIQKLSQIDPKTFRVVHQIPVKLGRAHGLAWAAPKAIWCMHSTERAIHKLDARDGRLLEAIQLTPDDPDPHGMCLRDGKLYYCDAGIGPDGKSNRSRWAGHVCRVDPL